ncbi:sensor domain-containing protein [Noviherbaspirillum humi]|uniref:sensor domain-containing protein n=1 Tax=Noviherbaspirillum humi TaxID=1688639 RepID=UPI0015951A48|nr:EAL domain-containing protein [Noviherbaspirillum humi]
MQWPAPLRTALQLMLDASQPMFLLLGPELLLFYNDAYATLLGARHPAAMLRPLHQAWPEAMHRWRSLIDRTLQGEPCSGEQSPPDVPPNGPPGQGRFSFSLLPVREDGGAVSAILSIWTELERRMVQEENLRVLLGQTARALWETDPDGTIIGDSPSWRRLTGQTREQWLAQGWIDAIHPEDRNFAAQQWRDAIATGMPLELELRLRLASGDWRWVELRAAPLPAGNGGIRNWLGMIIDIERRRRAEEDLLRAVHEAAAERRQLDAVLEAAPVGIIVADADGALVRMNSEVKRICGVDCPLSRSVAEYGRWKGWWADGSERHGEPLRAEDWPMSRALKGERVQHVMIEFEAWDARRQRCILLISAAPIQDGEGSITGAVVGVMDLTDHVRVEAELRQSQERFRKIVSQAATGVVEADAAGIMTLVNQKFCDMLGYSEAELIGKTVVDITAPDSVPHTLEAVARLAAGGPDFVIEKQYRRKDGTLMWATSSVNAMRGADGDYQGLVAIVVDITDRKMAEARVRHASLHDTLTGLPNRAMLFEYASHLLPHNRRTGQRAAVLFIDLDRFKPINDTHGHEAGDQVLREVAARLAASLRAEDIVIRLGGDEFIVLLQDIHDAIEAAEVTRHAVARISTPYHVGELALSLSASVGISLFPEDGQDIDTLISHADLAMYQAKQAGRNNFQFYSAACAAGARQQIAIEQQLKAALHDRAFHLCYQPVVDIESGEVVSAEALLRWPNRDIGPDRFVPVAEATGIINPIGRWLLREASRQYRRWQDHGLPSIPIAVNVSVVEFRDRDFAGRFERTMREYGIDTDALQLEVTETAIMDDVDHAVAILSRLKALGVKILLDDFGTGHSSLAYLARLPLNKVKIDRSFVAPLTHDVASQAVTNAMIALGRTLDLEVVAEGVESKSVLDYIGAHGCKQAQGFYLGRPMPGEEFEVWYRQRAQGVLPPPHSIGLRCH